jgi:hypothetical protein
MSHQWIRALHDNGFGNLVVWLNVAPVLQVLLLLERISRSGERSGLLHVDVCRAQIYARDGRIYVGYGRSSCAVCAGREDLCPRPEHISRYRVEYILPWSGYCGRVGCCTWVVAAGAWLHAATAWLNAVKRSNSCGRLDAWIAHRWSGIVNGLSIIVNRLSGVVHRWPGIANGLSGMGGYGPMYCADISIYLAYMDMGDSGAYSEAARWPNTGGRSVERERFLPRDITNFKIATSNFTTQQHSAPTPASRASTHTGLTSPQV